MPALSEMHHPVITRMLAICFLLVLCRIILASGDCLTFTCSAYGVSIRFPFQMHGHEIDNCGYPGFVLSCNNQSKTVLNLPRSGDFLVRKINYLSQQIQLYDRDNCLARRLLEFDLSGSPFSAISYQNYTFLRCPTQNVGSLTTIPCLSNSTTSVLAAPSRSLAVSSMSSTCTTIATLSIPVSGQARYAEGFTDDINDDMQLAWFSPDCQECESKGNNCGLEGTNGEVGCSSDTPKGRTGTASGLQTFKVISLSVVIPVLLLSTGIALCALLTNERSQPGANSRLPLNSAAVAASTQPEIMMRGLDDSTIESYEKVVLGESKRLPGPNDTSCAICLCEYQSKDAVRCIPECKHCFHAECIDQWLRLNSSCPVCRNSPSPSPSPSSAPAELHNN